MLLSSLAIALALTQASQRDSLGPAKDLKILYAGAPGEEREERFMDFLEPWFAQVDPISLADLDAKSAAPYDVVIVDWKRQYVKGNPRDDAEAPISLDASFAKPAILLGAMGGSVQRHSKLDWL